MNDYYATLGVARDADDTAIKRAFRDQARRLHPDVNRHDPEAEEKFKELNEAYEVLSDPKRRAVYDRFGTTRPQDIGGFGDADFGFGAMSDIFGMFFGDAGSRRAPDLSGRDLVVELELDLGEAAFGAAKDVSFERAVPCDACEATGAAGGASPEPCATCGGLGVVRTQQRTFLGVVTHEAPCARCGGLGEVIEQPCTECDGRGRVAWGDSLSVDVPPGVDDGTTLRLTGAGDAGVRGARAGDLFVHVRVRPHEVFERHGDDLYAVLPLSFSQAALGVKLTVTGLDEDDVRVSVPAGTQPGDQFVVRGAGVPRLNGRGRGDLIIQSTVEVPRRLKADERKLLQQLADKEGRDGAGRLVSPTSSRKA